MLRSLACVLLVSLLGCSSHQIDRAQAINALTTQAKQVKQAMLQPDHELMADLTHEAVVKGMGGRDRFIQRLKEIASEMAAQGFSMKDLALSDPSELYQSKGNVYAIVPFKLELTGPGGATGFKSSCLIGMSMDGGLNWKFIDGEGIANDRAKLHQVFPDFPEKLVLPSVPNPQWKK